jgi:putative DNA primase/helicase
MTPEEKIRAGTRTERVTMPQTDDPDFGEPPDWLDEGSSPAEPSPKANGQATEAVRQRIELRAGELHLYADQSERLLADSVYVRGQRLARLGLAPELTKELAKALARNPHQRVIVPVNTEWLRRTLNACAGYQKYSRVRKQWEPTDCPTDLVRNIAEAGDWQHFRPLEGIATAPFLRADGTVCDTPGYDPAARVFYAPNAEYSPLPAAPTRNDANAAAERLLAPFAEFPFASDDARAGFLAHVLASVARHAIDTRPVLVYSAPLVACGKTLLAGMASRIADGVEPAERPYSDDSEEMRKVLMSALLAADSTIMLDNVPNGSKVRSPILCGFATAPVYADRKLGVSESPALTNRCTVILTGNNITPASDLARRCIVVRLDVQAETARGRDFRIPDLKAYIREHRSGLLVDALTIIRAHVLAGSPTKLRPLESFERWSRFARDPVAWLGYGDAVATQELETEDELAPLRAAFQVMAAHPKFSAEPFAARELARAAEQYVIGDDLRAAIEAAGCGDATNPMKIGYWLRAHRDRVAAGRKLVQSGTSTGFTQWRLKVV